MSFPTFNGAASEDAQEFLDNLEITCLVTGRDDDATRLRMFPLLMKAEAKVWFNTLLPANRGDWAGLRVLFLAKFGGGGETSESLWGKVCELRQGSLFEYNVYELQFVELWERWVASLRLGEAAPDFLKKDRFVAGLCPPLREKMKGRFPVTWMDAKDIARLKERKIRAPWFDRLAASIKFPERKISFKFREKDMYIVAQESGSSKPVVNDQAFEKSIKSSISAYMIFVKDSLSDVNKTQLNESGMHEDLELSKFLNQFQDVFIDEILGELPPERGDDDHAIELIPGSSPPNKPPYRVSQAQQEEIMRQVNKLVEKEMGSTYSSRIDLKSGYHQIRIVDEDILKTAFRTTFGLYEYLVMPFGLTNAPATFNRMMEQIFQPHRNFIGVFFDDVIIYSKFIEEHKKHLQEKLLEGFLELTCSIKYSPCLQVGANTAAPSTGRGSGQTSAGAVGHHRRGQSWAAGVQVMGMQKGSGPDYGLSWPKCNLLRVVYCTITPLLLFAVL
ncbi:hypothetical protein L7F22_045851 [Adiantum nelumboides]|nr:hypothetical protein [Adiantum nelumboides]